MIHKVYGITVEMYANPIYGGDLLVKYGNDLYDVPGDISHHYISDDCRGYYTVKFIEHHPEEAAKYNIKNSYDADDVKYILNKCGGEKKEKQR